MEISKIPSNQIYCIEVMNISYLSDLMPGETAYIYSIAESDIRCRLIDLGLLRGTRIECVTNAPAGGPGAYLVRGTVVALRRADARTVSVQRIPSESSKMARWKPIWD